MGISSMQKFFICAIRPVVVNIWNDTPTKKGTRLKYITVHYDETELVGKKRC